MQHGYLTIILLKEGEERWGNGEEVSKAGSCEKKENKEQKLEENFRNSSVCLEI